jgi:hypothetical protein
VPCTGLARRIGAELVRELDGLRARRAVIDNDLHQIRDDVATLEVTSLERFDNVGADAYRAVIERSTAGGMVVGQRRRGDEVEAEIAPISAGGRRDAAPSGQQESDRDGGDQSGKHEGGHAVSTFS